MTSDKWEIIDMPNISGFFPLLFPLDSKFANAVQQNTEWFNTYYMISPCIDKRFTIDHCRDVANVDI